MLKTLNNIHQTIFSFPVRRCNLARLIFTSVDSEEEGVVSRVPDSLAVRRESGQNCLMIACPRNPWRVNWFSYRTDVL